MSLSKLNQAERLELRNNEETRIIGEYEYWVVPPYLTA